MDHIQFLQKLIKINSSNPPGNEHLVTEAFTERCKEKGLPFKITPLGGRRSNFEVTLEGKGDKNLFLCGHMDTVSPGKQEWQYPPFSGEIRGDKIYGRGASDMKSGLAGMFLALETIFMENQTPPSTITFLATAGEEVDSCGARAFMNENDRKIDALIIGEPTNERIVIGHKGALWLEIVCFGKTAHGSMPEQGINAVDHMVQIINLLETLKLDWKTTADPLGESSLAVTMIEGGIQTNVIPDKCTIKVDIRTVPPQEHPLLIAELKEKLNRLVQTNRIYQYLVSEVLDRPAILTSPSEDIIQLAQSIKEQYKPEFSGVPYYTDAAVINPRSDIPTLIYGPGDEKLAHQPDEWVSLASYKRTIEFYRNILLRYGRERVQ